MYKLVCGVYTLNWSSCRMITMSNTARWLCTSCDHQRWNALIYAWLIDAQSLIT